MQQSTRVLIVDDVPLMREMLRHILVSHGCENVEFAGRGDEAIAMVRSGRFDIVFLDINMPGTSGLRVLEQLREMDEQLFVVMVSAHSSADNVKQAIDSGADGFLVKPTSSAKVKQLLVRYRARAVS
jgi:two-component system chemotaxis response regulator CheY